MLSDLTGLADNLSTFIKDYYTEEIFAQSDFIPEFENTNLETKKMEFENKKVNIEINKVSDVFEIL